MSALLTQEELERALLQYCRSAGNAPDPAKIASEDQFARGIGGSKADHVAEKVFSDLVRDNKPAQPNADAECYKATMFENWLYGNSLAAQEFCKGKRAPSADEYGKGRWIRALNSEVSTDRSMSRKSILHLSSRCLDNRGRVSRFAGNVLVVHSHVDLSDAGKSAGRFCA